MFRDLIKTIPSWLTVHYENRPLVVCGCYLALMTLATYPLSADDLLPQAQSQPAVDPIPPAAPAPTAPAAPASEPVSPAATSPPASAEPAPAAPATAPIDPIPPAEAPSPAVVPEGVEIPLVVAAPPADITPAAIEQTQPRFFVHADTDPASREFYDGEQIKLKIQCEVDAFIYVLYMQADGLTYVVLPNSGSSVNKVPAKQEVRIPGVKDSFRWTVSAPFGKERIKVIASTVRIPALEAPEMRKRQATPIGQKQIEELVKEIQSRIPTDQWSEVAIEITTAAGAKPAVPSNAKRYGLFFSVPFQLSTGVNALRKNDPSLQNQNLGLPTVTDGLLLKGALRLVQGLDESAMFPDPFSKDIQQFVGTLAFRDRIKLEITEHLPEVAKAGDTVIIYFSGHGATFPDPRKNGALQSYLVPCDALDFETLMTLLKIKDAGLLKPDDLESKMLAKAEKILDDEKIDVGQLREAKWQSMTDSQKFDLASKIEILFIEKTAITSDEFSHWIQSLSHCRVVVILDACMSGGFATAKDAVQTKTLSPGSMKKQLTNPNDFQFFQPQMERLKSLGDLNTALLAAARINETSLQAIVDGNIPATSLLSEAIKVIGENKILPEFFGEGEFQPSAPRRVGIFTYYIVQTLLTAKGPLSLEQAAERSNEEMKQFFNSQAFLARHERANEERKKQGKPPLPVRTHHPVYFDHCAPKTVLKPL